MGEAKRRKEILEEAARLTDSAADAGHLIDVGFAALVLARQWKDKPMSELQLMRLVFFSGCEFIYNSIMGMIEGRGDQPTQQDLDRMEKLDREVNRIKQQLELWFTETQGNG